MRFLGFFLCSSLGVTNVAAASIPAWVRSGDLNDRELVTSLEDLNARYRIVARAKVARTGTLISIAGMTAFPALLVVRRARDYNRLLVVAASSWLAAMVNTGLGLGNAWLDGRRHESHNRVYGANDPDELGARALAAFGEFFSWPLREQYLRAIEHPDLRNYLIELDQWMVDGVTSGPAPEPLRP